MKRYLKIIMLVLILMFISTVKIYSADYSADNTSTVTLKMNPSTAKIGDNIEVTISAKVPNELEAIDTVLEYDANKLKLVEYEVNEHFQDLSGKDEETEKMQLSLVYGTLTSPSKGPAEAELVKFEFKVLDKAVVGEELSIKLSELSVFDFNLGEVIKKENKEEKVKIIENEPVEENDIVLSQIKITKKPTKTDYTVGEKFDKTGMEITAIYSDGTSKVIDNYTYSPEGELKETDQIITITYKEGEITKTATQAITVKAKVSSGETPKEEPKEEPKGESKGDGTQADKNFIKAGVSGYAFIAIPVTIILAIIFFNKYKKYSGIK